MQNNNYVLKQCYHISYPQRTLFTFHEVVSLCSFFALSLVS